MPPELPVGTAAEAAGSVAQIRVLVAYSPAPRQVDRTEVCLPAGATVADALRLSGLVERHGLHLDETLGVGVWMKARLLTTVLRQDDRVEVWRGLRVDPKEARRQRYRKQVAKPPLKPRPQIG